MTTRRFWLNTMLDIASPVLRALAEDRLAEKMPIESKSPREDRAQYTYLEAFGRTMVGLAPWLEAEGLTGEEAAWQAEYRALSLRCMHNAVTPGTKDCMNFSNGHQPIVDAAFLAHAILRAPKALWEALPAEDKRNLVARMKETRTRKPYACNWLLFSAMIECFLRLAGERTGTGCGWIMPSASISTGMWGTASSATARTSTWIITTPMSSSPC